MSMTTLSNIPAGAENYSGYGVVAVAYLIGGIAGGIIPWGIAEVIGKLEKLEASRGS